MEGSGGGGGGGIRYGGAALTDPTGWGDLFTRDVAR
jgi:hypothetical protein